MRHDKIIQIWPSVTELSVDIGVSEFTVRGWKRRRSIPVWMWGKVLRAATKRNIALSVEILAAGAPARSPRAA